MTRPRHTAVKASPEPGLNSVQDSVFMGASSISAPSAHPTRGYYMSRETPGIQDPIRTHPSRLASTTPHSAASAWYLGWVGGGGVAQLPGRLVVSSDRKHATSLCLTQSPLCPLGADRISLSLFFVAQVLPLFPRRVWGSFVVVRRSWCHVSITTTVRYL